MGKAVSAQMTADSCFEFVGGVDFGDSDSAFFEVIKNADVVIDFSTPVSAVKFAHLCAMSKKPFISGVTGLTREQIESIKKESAIIPVFISSNMSPAVNLLAILSGYIAKKLPDFDVHITEIHHTAKKDKPSGTAKNFADIIEKFTGKEPEISSIRSGGVVGVHSVLYGGKYETIEITHRAGERTLFALGALNVASWLVNQKSGFYSFNDLFDLKELGI